MFNDYDERYIEEKVEAWRKVRVSWEYAKAEGNTENANMMEIAVDAFTHRIAGVIEYIKARDGRHLIYNFYYGVLTVLDLDTGKKVSY